MNLMELYSGQTIEEWMFWISNIDSDVFNLRTVSVDMFKPHPDYKNVFQGVVVIDHEAMEELTTDYMFDGWDKRLKVFMVTFLNESKKAYKVIYHKLESKEDGSWLLSFNCEEF